MSGKKSGKSKEAKSAIKSKVAKAKESVALKSKVKSVGKSKWQAKDTSTKEKSKGKSAKKESSKAEMPKEEKSKEDKSKAEKSKEDKSKVKEKFKEDRPKEKSAGGDVKASKSQVSTAKGADAGDGAGRGEDGGKNAETLAKIIKLLESVKAENVTPNGKDDLDKIQTLLKNIAYRDNGEKGRVRQVKLNDRQKGAIQKVTGLELGGTCDDKSIAALKSDKLDFEISKK